VEETPSPANARCVLVVDDEEHVRGALTRSLRREHLSVVSAGSAAEALAFLERADPLPLVVISDLQMPGMDGVAFLGEVRRRWPRVQRVLLTGFADVANLQRAINETEIFRFVSKPWEEAILLTTVHSAFEEISLREENERLLRLSEEQNRELIGLTKELEARVDLRTRQLERAKREWEITFDAIVDPVSIIDLDYRVRRSNRAYAEHAGKDVREVPGQKCHSTLTREHATCKGCPVAAVLAAREAASGEVLDRHQDRTFKVFAFPIFEGEQGEIRNVVCYYRDVTEEKELHQRLVQTEKMAAVGQLAGGVAHEINNPLGGVLAFTQLLMREFPKDGDYYSYLTEIESSALRCKRIVESLLKFSRRSPGTQRLVVDLNEVIRSTVFLVEHQYQLKNVTIEQDLHPELWSVKANANQMSQVFLNLLTNAFGALSKGGGTIRVQSWNDPDRDRVQVSVSDTGKGIPQKDLPKIFEPFFTTKAEGEGTGLGLTVTLDIVQAHGGTIEVESEEGKGACFRVALPAWHAGAGGETPAPEEGRR
jgi:two-component system NtrC family sensor kinase